MAANPSDFDPSAYVEQLRSEAAKLGFNTLGVTTPEAFHSTSYEPAAALDRFIAEGWHGDMGWMETHRLRRRDPQELWPYVRSIIMLGASYAPSEDPMAILDEKDRHGIFARARGKDYHDILKGRLKQLARQIHEDTNRACKVFVDTAPLMEKPLAAAAGLGWQGKHTNLVSTTEGSWLFLGAILTAANLPVSSRHEDRCGSCRRCIDVCPTNAFPAPYQLDARRCISYLTIEHKGHIPRAYRRAIANRVFGCDDCLAVCPWNKFAAAARETRFAARQETDNPPLGELLALDDTQFRTRFAGTPIKRTGRDRFMRNVLIAVGNSGNQRYVGAIINLLEDQSPLVRAMAVWALSQIAERNLVKREAGIWLPLETDDVVMSEWRYALRRPA